VDYPEFGTGDRRRPDSRTYSACVRKRPYVA
jgi:hypothetical protein